MNPELVLQGGRGSKNGLGATSGVPKTRVADALSRERQIAPPAQAAPTGTAAQVLPRVDRWTKWIFFLLVGYSLFGRTFAYIGVRPLFIGDAFLGCFILFNTRAVLKRWYSALVRDQPLSFFSWALVFFMLFGVFELVRGIFFGHDAFTALQLLVFNVYPLYIFAGLWAGERRPDMVKRFIFITAWFSAIYGPLYLAVLHKINWSLPGAGPSLLPQAGSGPILGMLAVESRTSKYWFPLTIAVFMLFAMQLRGEWVGLGLSILVWAFLEKKLSRVALFGLLATILLGIGFVGNVQIPGPRGTISTQTVVMRLLSIVTPEKASEVSKEAAVANGTVHWREVWWKNIRNEVLAEKETTIIGLGYGYPLHKLNPSLAPNEEVRTPHSILYFTFAYSGLVGMAIFFTLQATLGGLLWRTFKVTGNAFGLATWAATLATSLFGNCWESPPAAIPTYILLGLCILPGLMPNRAKNLVPNTEAAPLDPLRSSNVPRGQRTPVMAFNRPLR
jgi:hypothetical protein